MVIDTGWVPPVVVGAGRFTGIGPNPAGNWLAGHDRASVAGGGGGGGGPTVVGALPHETVKKARPRRAIAQVGRGIKISGLGV